MANRLNIYACSGIGAAESEYTYWTAGTVSQNNSQAVNNLLAKINLEYSKITNLELSDEEALRALDNIDLYCVCMYYAREYSENESELHHVGQVIGDLVQAGTFESNLITDEERGAHLDELFDIVNRAMDTPAKENKIWMDWWRDNVESLNQVGLSQQQQTTVTRSLMGDAIGDVDYGNADLNKYLNNAGEYFLYTYFTAEQIKKLPAVFNRKATLQKQLHQYCQALYKKVNGNVASMDDIIRAGIISTFGKEPKDVTNTIYNQYLKDGRIGDAASIAAIIGAIASITATVASLIVAIVKCVKDSKVAEAESINEKAISGAQPADADFPPGYGGKEGGAADNSTLIWIGAAIVAALLLFKK